MSFQATLYSQPPAASSVAALRAHFERQSLLLQGSGSTTAPRARLERPLRNLSQSEHLFAQMLQRRAELEERIRASKIVGNFCQVSKQGIFSVLDTIYRNNTGYPYTINAATTNDSHYLSTFFIEALRDCPFLLDYPQMRDRLITQFERAANDQRAIFREDEDHREYINCFPLAQGLVQDLREGKARHFYVGWQGHVFTLSFCSGYLVIGNGGERPTKETLPITAFKINLQNITLSLLEELFLHYFSEPIVGATFFYEKLPLKLKGEKDRVCLILERLSYNDHPNIIKHDPLKLQVGGTCPGFALEIALIINLFFFVWKKKQNISFEALGTIRGFADKIMIHVKNKAIRNLAPKELADYKTADFLDPEKEEEILSKTKFFDIDLMRQALRNREREVKMLTI